MPRSPARAGCARGSRRTRSRRPRPTSTMSGVFTRYRGRRSRRPRRRARRVRAGARGSARASRRRYAAWRSKRARCVVAARLDRPTRLRSPPRGAPAPNSRGSVACGARPAVADRYGFREVTERRTGDDGVRADPRREPTRRRPPQRPRSRPRRHRSHRPRAGGIRLIARTDGEPKTRSSSSSRPSRPRKSMPTAVRHAATTSVTNPPLDR